MKRLLLAATGFLFFINGHSQTTNHNNEQALVKGATFVKRESGTYTDPQRKNVVGSYSILYAIDTVKHELLTVSTTSKDGRGETIYLFYYQHNTLVKSSSGVVQNGYTIIQNTYGYDDDDYKMSAKDLDAFSASDEKYALLKESRKYLRVLTKL